MTFKNILNDIFFEIRIQYGLRIVVKSVSAVVTKKYFISGV